MGFDATMAHQQEQHDRLTLLNAWTAIPAWSDSFAYLERHHDDLSTAEVRQLLADHSSNQARQYHAILDLVDGQPIEQVQAIVVDPSHAEEAVLEAIESGNLELITTIALASGRLPERPTTKALVDLVIFLAEERTDEALNVAEQIANSTSEVQRRAHAIRLAGFGQRHPTLPVDQAITVINNHRSPKADDAARNASTDG